MDKRYSLFFGILSFLLLAGGTFSPGWLVFKVDAISELMGEETHHNVTIHLGLFFVFATNTSESEIASLHSVKDFESEFSSIVLEYQIESCLAVFFCICGIVCLLMYNESKKASFLGTPMCLLIIAGALIWLAAGRWVKRISPWAVYKLMKTPYSLIISCAGGVMCVVSAILTCILKIYDDRNISLH